MLNQSAKVRLRNSPSSKTRRRLMLKLKKSQRNLQSQLHQMSPLRQLNKRRSKNLRKRSLNNNSSNRRRSLLPRRSRKTFQIFLRWTSELERLSRCSLTPILTSSTMKELTLVMEKSELLHLDFRNLFL